MVSFRKRYEKTRKAATRTRRGTPSMTRIIKEMSSMTVFSVMLLAPPELNGAGKHVVYDAVEGLLLFLRWRILPIALDFLYLPDYVADIGHGRQSPDLFSDDNVAGIVVYNRKIALVGCEHRQGSGLNLRVTSDQKKQEGRFRQTSRLRHPSARGGNQARLLQALPRNLPA
jgi:hypothetical protein